MKNLNKWKWQYRSIRISCYGHYYYSNIGCFRNPKTYGELKAYDKEYSRRKRRHIPNAWDDKPISRGECKSWKDTSKRKKQWKNCEHSDIRLELLKKK